MRNSSSIKNGQGLDTLDVSIIRALQSDARKPFTDIAKSLGVAESTVRNRVSRLKADGTLRLGATFDFMRLGFNASAFMTICVQPGTIDNVAARLETIAEVSYLLAITGNADLMVELTCRDHIHLKDTVKAIRKIDGITRSSTQMILHVYKELLPSLDSAEKQRHKASGDR